MSRPLILALALGSAASPLAAQSPAAEPQTRNAGPAAEILSGVEYQQGRYGLKERSERVSVPTTFRVATGRVQLSASIPYVRVDGPANLVGGGFLGLPIVVDPTRSGTRTRREGLGDVRAAASYRLPTRAVGVSLSGEVKLPTASRAKGLGTGATDFSLGAEISKRVGAVTPFAALAYTLPGESEGLDLRNAISARAGAALQMGPAVRGHLAYGVAQSLSPDLEKEQQVTTGLNASVSRALSVGLYGSAGLSGSAPDLGAGIQLGVRIR